MTDRKPKIRPRGSGRMPTELEIDQIIQAARENDVEILMRFSESGVDVAAANWGKDTPLHTAAFNGCTEVVQMFVEAGANVNTKQFQSDETPLHRAAEAGHYEEVKILVEAGANIEAKDSIGWTPLTKAVLNCHANVVQYLVNDKKASLSPLRGQGFLDKAKALLIEEILNPPKKPRLSAHAHRSDKNFEKLYYHTKHKLGSEKLQVCKLLIFGPPGAGKSSLLKVLLSENPNPNQPQNSTGVCDRKLVQCNIVVTSPQDGPTQSIWTKVNLEQEIKYLRSKLKTKVTGQSTKLSSPEKFDHKMAVEKKMFTFDTYDASTTGRRSSTAAQAFPNQVAALIACYDSGGQPEFFDVMPAFITSPTGYVMVFDMSKDFQSKENVQYYKEGKKCSSVNPMHYISGELIKTALANIQSNPAIYSRVNSHSVALGPPPSGKLLVAGTHLDICGETEEEQCSKVVEIEKIMVEDVMKLPTEFLHNVSQRSEKNTKVVYPISNIEEKGRDEIAQEIRSAIERMAAKDEEISNDIPISWMLFQLEIRLTEKYYISRQRCIDIAKLCYIDERDVDSVLMYFHELGMLLYYEGVPSLKQVIFCDPQWLFDKLTKLIEVKYDPPLQYKDMIKNGIFDRSLLRGVYGNDFESSDILNLGNLLDLFVFLNIIAVLPGKKDQYFMPALLNPVPTNIGASLEEFCGTKIFDTMLVKFEKTYFPRGVFCCLVTECMKRWVGWNIQYSKDIYRNLIIFQTSADHDQYIFLKDKIDSIGIEMYHRGNQTMTTSPDVISSTINQALHKVCKKMKINSDFKFGFACRCLHTDRTPCNGFAVVISQIPFQTKSACEKCNHRNVLEDDQVGWLISIQFLKDKANSILQQTRSVIQKPISMKVLYKIVIPKVSAHWKKVLAFLECTPAIKNEIEQKHHGDPHDCCVDLFEKWIESNQGVGPKTYNKLLEVLDEIKETAGYVTEMRSCLQQEGVFS